MAATTFNLYIEQGIPYSQTFIVKNPDLSLKDLTGYTARMQFRASYGNPAIAMNATTTNGRLIIDSGSSTCTIQLSEDDTSGLIFTAYVYDVELVSATLVPVRMVQGQVVVNPEVTR